MNIVERNIEEIEDHGEYILTRTIKEVFHSKEELEKEAEAELEAELEEELISSRVAWERLPEADACSNCGGNFSE